MLNPANMEIRTIEASEKKMQKDSNMLNPANIEIKTVESRKKRKEISTLCLKNILYLHSNKQCHITTRNYAKKDQPHVESSEYRNQDS